MQRGDLWVFGYGSLMWKPGFPFAEKRLARLDGYARRFAMWSWHYRGTREVPGLVLGLDWSPGTACDGMAFRIPAGEDRAVRAYLQERELISYAYFEVLLPVTLHGETPVQAEALCYILDRTHPQYAGTLTDDERAAVIARAAGTSGPNADYLSSTATHLDEMGVRDSALADLNARVRMLSAA